MIKKSISNRLNVVRAACLKTNRSFELCRDGSRFMVINKKIDSEALRSCLTDPDTLMDTGTLVKNSRTTKAVLTQLEDGTKVFIKRYNNKGFKYSLKYMLRKARAFRAWKSAWSLEVCGVPTPKNYAAVSFRHLGKLNSAFLITEMLENTVDILDFYKTIQNNKKLRLEFIDDVVRMISILHENGIRHGDLKLSNIFIQKWSETNYSFGLWDLDGTQYFQEGLNDVKRRSELARVIASYIEMGMRIDIKVNRTEIEGLFLNAYARYTMVGLNGKTIIDLIDKFVTKSHKRIITNK